MKKRIFKFGAALTAALMICSATAGLAFADEIDAEVPETTEPAAVDTVDEAAPEEEAVEEEAPAVEEEAPAEEAEDVEEVVVPLEKEDITVADVAEAAEDVKDVPTGSAISIGDITSSSDEDYYTVSVPFSVSEAPDQITLFVYNITNIAGEKNNTAQYTTDIPVGYINQYPGDVSGTYIFKLSKTGDNAYKDGDIIVVKIGGTDVTTPDAKSYTLASGGEGPTPDVKYGDVDLDGNVNATDAILIMQAASSIITLTDEQRANADVDANNDVNATDAIYIMQSAAQIIDKFPAEQ